MTVERSSSARTARAALRASAPASASASPPPAWSATSTNGPSGLGVARFSHAPARIRASVRARNARDEAGLADTRLPADEHEAPALAPGVFQEREQLLPLEQLRHVRLHGAPTLTERVRPHDPGEARGASRLAP